MDAKDGKGAGDGSAPKKKRAPSARKRTAKTATSAEQNGVGVAERDVEVGGAGQPEEQADGTERNPRDTGISTPRAADQADSGDPRFGEAQAERAAEVAGDLKSWMDTRREDRGVPREVL